MTRLYLNDTLIDLYGTAGLSINYFNSEIDNFGFGDTKGNYSYELSIPATKTNKKELYFPELDLIESFDETIQKEARLEVDGTLVLNGYARIKAIVQKGKLTEYKIILFDGNSSWLNLVKNKSLRDMDYSFYDHEYRSQVALQTEVNSLVSYPIINYGTEVRGEGNWSLEDVYPSFSVKKVLDDIFYEAGYDYSSEFIDSDFFNRLYFTTDKVPEKRAEDYLPWRFDVGLSNVVYTSFNGGNGGLNKDIVIPFDKDTLFNDVPHYNTDNTGVVNLGTTDCNYYNVGFNGKMSFVWEYALFNVSDAAVTRKSVDYTLRLWRQRNGVNTIIESRELNLPKAPVTGGVINSSNTTLGTFTSKSYDVKEGDRYFFTARLLTSTTQDHFTGIAANNRFRNKVYSTLVEGDTIYISDNIPDILQSDFIKDIKTMFNLYFVTDEINKKIYIEPRNTFYSETSEDWSEKLDLSKPIETSYLGANLGKTVRFEYADDSNDKYIKFKEKTLNDNNKWLSKEVSVSNLSAKDSITTRGLKNFASTFIGSGISSAPSAKIPIIWDSESEEKPSKRVKKWKSRILYYRGRVNLYGSEVWKYNGGNYKTYPQYTTNYVATDGVFKHENSLDWNESNYGEGLYNLYYDNTINTINNSRRINAYIKLNSLDILNLDFRKPKYIEIEGDGNYYYLEKIHGYKPESVDSLKCTFVKVIQESVLAEKYVSPINIHEYPAKAEDNNGEIFEEEAIDLYNVVCTEKQWQSTTDVPSGEFVDVYVEIKHNVVRIGDQLTDRIRVVKYG